MWSDYKTWFNHSDTIMEAFHEKQQITRYLMKLENEKEVIMSLDMQGLGQVEVQVLIQNVEDIEGEVVLIMVLVAGT